MHRGWMDNPALGGDREPFCRRAAWAWLIENANWKVAKVDAGGTTVVVERGQLCASFRYLSKAWGWSLGKVQLFIDRLKTDTMINTAVNTGRMIITICNYEKYQATIETANTPSNTVANTPPIREQYESKKESKKEEYTNGPASNSRHTHTEPSPALRAGGGKVAFLGSRIRLDGKKVAELEKKYPEVPDLMAALGAIDAAVTNSKNPYGELHIKLLHEHNFWLKQNAKEAGRQKSQAASPASQDRTGVPNALHARRAARHG